jgi:hypothetical protein
MDVSEVLRKLKAGSPVPKRVRDPALRAVAELAEWLHHPTELGQYPDDVEILDRRTIYWPPAGATLPLTLLRFHVHAETGFEPGKVGIGLVGSVTFSMVSYENHQRPVEDCYAIHCYWECSLGGGIVEATAVSPEQVVRRVHEGDASISNPALVLRVRFRKPVGYPADDVLLVSGESHGSPGWLVCDGPRTTWYPESEMPDGVLSKTVLMVHAGRVLLGLETRGVQRARYKGAKFHLDDTTFLARYEQALEAARDHPTSKKKAFDSFGPIARHAQRYVELLTAGGRSREVKRLISELVPYCDHNHGYAELGKLAFTGKLFDVSKHFLEKLRGSYKDHHRSETMALLAHIYAGEGRRAEGITLLHDCIGRIEADNSCSPREVAFFSEPLRAALRELEAPATG